MVLPSPQVPFQYIYPNSEISPMLKWRSISITFNKNPYMCPLEPNSTHLFRYFTLSKWLFPSNKLVFNIFLNRKKIFGWTHFSDDIRHHFSIPFQVTMSTKVSWLMGFMCSRSIYSWIHCNKTPILSYFLRIFLSS